ncbi:MAG: hypothetical protein ACREEL_14670 [Stellaceae bacterium]
MTGNTGKIALIGFGEVGSLFARELLATGRHWIKVGGNVSSHCLSAARLD